MEKIEFILLLSLCKKMVGAKTPLDEITLHYNILPKQRLASREEINQKFKDLRDKKNIANDEFFLLPFLDFSL